jgi:hypothetical protein
MLGEMIGEESGKITGIRVLPPEGGVPKIESSMQATGKLVGVEVTNIATIWSMTQPDGTLYIDGQGVVMAKDGGIASFVGWGFGRLTASGGVSQRGAINCQSASGSLGRLSGMVIPFEAEVDADQNIRWRFWEWK